MRLSQSNLARPNLPALALGAALLVAGSLARAAAQPILGVAPILAASSTCLVFVIPAFVAGAVAPRAALLDGAILGMLGAAFVTLQAAQFHQPSWSSLLVYEMIGLLACLGVPLCLLGAVLGGKLFRARQSGGR